MPNITIALLEEFMNDLIGSRSQVHAGAVPVTDSTIMATVHSSYLNGPIIDASVRKQDFIWGLSLQVAMSATAQLAADARALQPSD